jgi:hypothetical protein
MAQDSAQHLSTKPPGEEWTIRVVAAASGEPAPDRDYLRRLVARLIAQRIVQGLRADRGRTP